jgi:hypothetical protein
LGGPKGLKKRSPPGLTHRAYSAAFRKLSRVIRPDLLQFFRDCIKGLVPAYFNPPGVYPATLFRICPFERVFDPVRVIDLLNHAVRLRAEAPLILDLVLKILQFGVGLNTYSDPIDPVYP